MTQYFVCRVQSDAAIALLTSDEHQLFVLKSMKHRHIIGTVSTKGHFTGIGKHSPEPELDRKSRKDRSMEERKVYEETLSDSGYLYTGDGSVCHREGREYAMV